MKQNSQNVDKLFTGVITHQRIGAVEHNFKNTIISLLIELKSEKPELPFFFSIEKFNLLSWSASEHGLRVKNSNRIDLYKFIIKLISKSNFKKKEVSFIKLLTFPKILGCSFNPLSVYFCYDCKNILIYSVFEVKNTFGDIHHYILNETNKSEVKQKVLKKLFVSPFYQNKGHYHLHANYRKNHIITTVEYIMNNRTIFFASMKLKKINFSNFNIIKSIFYLTIFPGKIWVNIHIQAFLLWLKKIKLYKIPQSQKNKYSFGIVSNKKKN